MPPANSNTERAHNVAELTADAMEAEELGGLPLRNDRQVGDEKMLADLLSDPGETRDVAGQNLKMTRDLEMNLDGWRQELKI